MQTCFHRLGELQADHQALIQVYIPYGDYLIGDYISRKKLLFQTDLNITQHSKNILNEQRSLQAQDLHLTQTIIKGCPMKN